jgi:DHA2 family multidrug resistance protein
MNSTGLQYKWKVLIVAIFGTFMAILDATAVNVALNQLRLYFNADIVAVGWVVTAYTLALGIVTPVAGYGSDAWGIKRLYMMSLLVFVVGSLLCGIAPTLPVLVAARVLQGLGAGALSPLSLALLLSAFPREQRGLAFGIFGMPLVVAPALGPVLGGYLVEYLDWRYIFWVNLPVGLLGIVLAWRWLVESQRISSTKPDVIGLGLSAIGFSSVLYAASEVSNRGWTDPLVLSALGLGALALAVFAIHELRAPDPIVDLRLFSRPVFTLASLVGWVSVLALFGAEFLMPLYLQGLRGLKPFETGLLLLPLAIASGIVAPIAGVLYDRFGARPLLVPGFALIMLNTWQLSQIKLDTSLWDIGVILAIRGLGLGLIIQPTLNAALSVVSGRAVRRATSLVNASRQVFLSLGVAVLASVLQSHISTPPTPISFVRGFEDAYLVTFWAAVASFCLSLFVPGWPGRYQPPTEGRAVPVTAPASAEEHHAPSTGVVGSVVGPLPGHSYGYGHAPWHPALTAYDALTTARL